MRILFVDVVALPWSASYPWDDLKAQARSLPVSHPTIARLPLDDASSGDETDSTGDSIKALFPDVFDQVILEIRARNYSIRTEQSYVVSHGYLDLFGFINSSILKSLRLMILQTI